MAHKWVAIAASAKGVATYGWEPRRKCTKCGVVQQREAKHSWMRVVGYLWIPRVGRCKADRQ